VSAAVDDVFRSGDQGASLPANQFTSAAKPGTAFSNWRHSPLGKQQTSNLAFDTSIQTNVCGTATAGAATGSDDVTGLSNITRALLCECELTALRGRPFWRLFGLSVTGRTRSCFSTALRMPRWRRSPFDRFLTRCAAGKETGSIEPT